MSAQCVQSPDSGEIDPDEILIVAAGLEGAKQAAYLDHIAVRAPAVAERIRSRLAALGEPPTVFLERPAAEGLDAMASESDPVQPALGPEERYQIGELLGAGGMGSVYRAHDRQLERDVAIKFLKHDSPSVSRQLLDEARHQARVQHPNVLEVYDSGLLDSRPFVAIRLVQGSTLADDRLGLNLEQKIRLLIQAAEGLHAAHRVGLLHRDVKPSNILVEAADQGVVHARVTDFGLAVNSAASIPGAVGTLAGSPQYMAPERLQAEPTQEDRRADVYSLGVTLYRVLSGHLPFAGSCDTLDLLERVRNEPVPAPRQWAPSLPTELDAIILRCTARDPDQRYSSARAVARDLQRFLDGEVVEAYAAGLAYRLTRWTLRNRMLVGLSAMTLASLILASVGISVFALRADAARERAELRQAQAEALIRFTVVDLYEKLDELGRLDVMSDLGQATRSYFASIPESSLSPTERLQHSRMLYQIGSVHIRQGEFEAASQVFEQSLDVAKRLVDDAPTDSQHLFELAQSHFWIGYIDWQHGRLDSARSRFEAYLELALRLVGLEPDRLDWQRELAHAHSNLGSLLRAENELEASLEQFRATLEIDQALVRASEQDPEARSELAASHNMVGIVLQDLGRMSEAGRHLEANLDIRRNLLDHEPERPRLRDFLGTSHNDLGVHLSLEGQWSVAGTHFLRSHAIFQDLVGHDPSNTQWQFKLAWSQINLGRAAMVEARIPVARERMLAARSLIESLLSRDDPSAWRRTHAIIDYHLAVLDAERGRQSRDRLDAALATLQTLSEERPGDRSVRRWLSQAWLARGAYEEDPQQAQLAWRQALNVIEPLARDGHDVRLLRPWAAALRCLGHSEQARDVLAGIGSSISDEPGLDGLCPGSP